MSLFTDLKDVLTPYAQRIKGLAAADEEIKADLGTIIGGGTEQREIQFVYGSFINDGNAAEIGETVDLTNLTEWYSLKHAIVECQEGDEFLIDMAGATNARAWAFLTSNNVLLSRSNENETVTGKITAPQNAGKVIIQGIYRQSQTDTSTDNGTAYKVIAGAGKGVVVRFDTAQNLTDAEKAQARENIGACSNNGLSEDVANALLDCFEHVAWIDTDGHTYFNALKELITEPEYTQEVLFISGYSDSNRSVADTVSMPFIYAGSNYDYDYNARISAIELNVNTPGNLSIGYYTGELPNSGNMDASKHVVKEVININTTGKQKINLSALMSIPNGAYLAIGDSTDQANFLYGSNGSDKGFYYSSGNKTHATYVNASLGLNVYTKSLAL